MRLLLVDNYDSFTWNVAHYLEELGQQVDVRLNDEVDCDGVPERYDAIVVSPGPGRPEQAGCCLELIRALAGRLPLLGICLGHQALAVTEGARIVQAPSLMHGKTSQVHHDGRGVYRDLDGPFDAMRYHSLVVERESLPASLEITAWTEDGVIMGLRHRRLPAHGVQFHPESILTPSGHAILQGFLDLARTWRERDTHAAPVGRCGQLSSDLVEFP